MKKNISITTAFLIISSFSIHSAPIDPSSISISSGCGDTATDCTVNWFSQVYTPELAAVQINRSTGSSWLVRYNLYSPSSVNSTSYDDLTGQEINTTTPYTGHLWLEAPELLASMNDFNIYTDQVDQYTDSPTTYNFSMTETDTLAGYASYYNSGEPDYVETGSLIYNHTANICIECSFDFTLNLNGLDYSTGQLFVNANFINPQNALFVFNDALVGYGIIDRTSHGEFYVAPVPVPAAVWLFGSGLLGLLGFTGIRRKK